MVEFEWEPLNIERVVEMFGLGGQRWWLSGGLALERFAGFSWRDHEDIDIGILRKDIPFFAGVLQKNGFELFFAYKGELTEFDLNKKMLMENTNNLWCKQPDSELWQLDIPINEGDDLNWAYRRDPSMKIPWENVLMDSDGVSFMVPEVQLLFKSKNIREKDRIDAEHTIPLLSHERRLWLAGNLGSDHEWQKLLEM